MINHRRPGPPRTSARRVGQDRDRSIRQAHDVLRASIRRGLVAPNDALVEFQLTRSLGVARNALREALQALADEGLVVRRPAVGTLVARRMLQVSADEIIGFGNGFEDDLRPRVTSERLAAEPVELGADLRRTLGMAEDGTTQMIEIIVKVDDEPVCIVATYLPGDVDPDRFNKEYEAPSVSFERLLGVPLARTTTMVEAINADPWTASMLDVAPGAALVLREQLLTDASGTAAILNIARYRADRVAFIASAVPAPAPEGQ
ncbi:GntR family transcriptional regulator [Nakamurella leprariae]|uniref:GntR family transcriptional regulator n=1 Tax=Nakamurella leprariae TaxID=2803911 RepID=A0A939C423_9ACTN|nr:GntR family transcriptional regulator [Nakamurella leprariae]MBM9469647.1 GntR family transcriptional regulator [Nakamurella leprariae]